MKVGEYPANRDHTLSMANYKKILGKDASFNMKEKWAALVKSNEGELWAAWRHFVRV
jgi:hypothetical protein